MRILLRAFRPRKSGTGTLQIIKTVVDGILHGTPVTPDGQEGLERALLIDAIYRSAALGREVRFGLIQPTQSSSIAAFHRQHMHACGTILLNCSDRTRTDKSPIQASEGTWYDHPSNSWNEFRHEKANPVVAEIYPDGIHGALAEGHSATGPRITIAHGDTR